MRRFALLLIIIVVVALAGCGSKQPNSDVGTQYVIGMSQCNLGEP